MATFDLTPFKSVDIKTFDMRELRGTDSTDALARVIAPGGPGVPQGALNQLHTKELVATAITHVDGELVVSPFHGWNNWTVRTQEFVLLAYTRLNGITKIEMDAFLAASFGTPPEGSSSPSPSSSPGSPGI